MTKDEELLLNEKYLGERLEEFFHDCERLKEGEPLAYVIGHIPFLDTTIFLDLPATRLPDGQGQAGSRPLIPRPETEFWVEKILIDIASTHTPHHGGLTPVKRVLDLCAGSGCIGVAVAKALPLAQVDFVEIDERHHPTIQKNLEENEIEESRTRVIGGDLFQHVTDTYDVVLSNPPYIDIHLNRTDTSVIAHEPHTALFADNGGFALIERIMREAPKHLAPEGMLVIEHEPEHVPLIEALAQTLSLTSISEKDQYDVFRYTILTRKNIGSMPS